MYQKSKSGAVDVITATAPIIEDAPTELADVLTNSLTAGRPMAVLDMSQVELIDSQGLEGLVEQTKRFAEYGGGLRIASITPLVADVLRITGVAERVDSYPSVPSAVSAFLE